MINTLFIIQAEYQNMPTIISQLNDLYTEHDAVLLMQESLLFLHQPLFHRILALYVLADDALHLNIPATQHTNLKLINHTEWVDLILKSQKILTLK